MATDAFIQKALREQVRGLVTLRRRWTLEVTRILVELAISPIMYFLNLPSHSSLP